MEQGTRHLPSLDGVSLVSTFSGEKIEREDPLFFQYGSWQVLREDSWKLVQRKNDPWQLYDLAWGSHGNENLYIQFPDRVLQMKTRWGELAKTVGLKMKPQQRKKKPKTGSVKNDSVTLLLG